MLSPDDIPVRARRYAKTRGLEIVSKLGSGEDGWIGQSNAKTAIKCFVRERNYRNELRCYQRLKKHGLSTIDGFDIPTLVDHCELEMVIEMDVVNPPFILDFGKAYIDIRPDFPEELLREHEITQRDLWGDQWQQVQSIVWQLERVGIYYLDTKPTNIAFPGESWREPP